MLRLRMSLYVLGDRSMGRNFSISFNHEAEAGVLERPGTLSNASGADYFFLICNKMCGKPT